MVGVISHLWCAARWVCIAHHSFYSVVSGFKKVCICPVHSSAIKIPELPPSVTTIDLPVDKKLSNDDGSLHGENDEIVLPDATYLSIEKRSAYYYFFLSPFFSRIIFLLVFTGTTSSLIIHKLSFVFVSSLISFL